MPPISGSPEIGNISGWLALGRPAVRAFRKLVAVVGLVAVPALDWASAGWGLGSAAHDNDAACARKRCHPSRPAPKSALADFGTMKCAKSETSDFARGRPPGGGDHAKLHAFTEGQTPARRPLPRSHVGFSQGATQLDQSQPDQISFGLAVRDDSDGGKAGDRFKVHPFDEMRQCHRLERR